MTMMTIHSILMLYAMVFVCIYLWLYTLVIFAYFINIHVCALSPIVALASA